MGSGVGETHGSSSLTFSPAGSLRGSAALTGASTLTFAPAGTLTGTAEGETHGTSTLTFTPTGSLRAIGRLQGSSSFGFTSTGTLVDASAPVVQPGSGGGGGGGRAFRQMPATPVPLVAIQARGAGLRLLGTDSHVRVEVGALPAPATLGLAPAPVSLAPVVARSAGVARLSARSRCAVEVKPLTVGVQLGGRAMLHASSAGAATVFRIDWRLADRGRERAAWVMRRAG